jgi:hypothetical protein
VGEGFPRSSIYFGHLFVQTALSTHGLYHSVTRESFVGKLSKGPTNNLFEVIKEARPKCMLNTIVLFPFNNTSLIESSYDKAHMLLQASALEHPTFIVRIPPLTSVEARGTSKR